MQLRYNIERWVTNLNERIKYLRKELLHVTLEQFGSKVGLGKSAMSRIESGNNTATEQTVKSICREFGVSEEWLRTGKGEPFAAQTRNQKLLAFFNKTMSEEDDSIKVRLANVLADLDESEWDLLAKIAERIVKKD